MHVFIEDKFNKYFMQLILDKIKKFVARREGIFDLGFNNKYQHSWRI